MDTNEQSMHAAHMKSCHGRMCKVLVSLVLLTLIALFGTLAWKIYKQSQFVGRPENVRDTIMMRGRGEVVAVPDIAIVNAGLETTLPTVAEAQRKNTEGMNGFLAEVKGLGVEDKDRKTTSYQIEPKYETQYRPDGRYERQVLAGYTVRQNVQVKVRNLDKVSDVVVAAGKWGLNQVGNFSFTVDDQEGLKQQALEAAIKNAREKANAFARVAGVHLGKFVSFYEDSGPIPYGMGGGPMYAMEAKAMPAPLPPPRLEPGSQEIVVNVTVTYEIAP